VASGPQNAVRLAFVPWSERIVASGPWSEVRLASGPRIGTIVASGPRIAASGPWIWNGFGGGAKDVWRLGLG
jgi:hypothetical protein